MTVSENLEVVRERIARAAERAGLSPEDVTLVAATKMIPPPRILDAVRAGVKIIAENRVQEAQAKRAEVGGDAHWHLIGHLQRNKVKRALSLFELIQSVDSLSLAQEINRHTRHAGSPFSVLVEVNVSGEATKYGFRPEETLDAIGAMTRLPGLKIEGLMTIGPLTDDERRIRSSFALLRDLFRRIDKAGLPGVDMTWLSIGMTSDFEIAIEEGSNMVRIGTAIFGPRPTQ